MRILFVAGFGPIASDMTESRRMYEEALGIAFQANGDYLHTDQVDGVRSFAIWPLAQAAESCFGTDTWPFAIPKPQAWLEFDVDDLEEATRELEARGYQLLVRARKEPWDQIVTRLISPEGLLVGITLTPWMRSAR
jgi:hypothetical protein